MGQEVAVKLRSKLQAIFFKLGCFSRRNCWAVLAVGVLILIGLSVGIITATIETDVEKLWMEVDGRLEKEIQYTKDSLGEGSGTTNELLIHAANDDYVNNNAQESNILSVDSLQRHLKAVQAAIDVKVDIFGKTWTHTDLCYVPEVPKFNISLVDGIVSAIIPCLIISPLDCFWDGAKVLKLRAPLPDQAKVFPLEWTKSDPAFLLGLLDAFQVEGRQEIKDLFFKAGITKGYLEKPCLDPSETDCPLTAPNMKTGKAPNVKEDLTGGCKGFATEFMQWAEELLVGGTEKSNNTLKSAKALQTILVLTGPQDLYKRWADKSKDLNVEWNLDAAKKVLETWQMSFTEEINKNVTDTEEFNMLAFDSASVTALLQEFSQTSVTRIAIGYILMLVYACLTLKRWCDPINSHGALGFAGVLLVTLSVAAGLGFSALCGITFNAASTQVLPFLALGLGVDDMFLLAHSYSSLAQRADTRHLEEPVGYCVGTTGVSVFLTSFNNMLAFFMAALIPIPALRYFAIQAAVIVIFNFIGVIIIFPAMIAIDVKRRQDQRYDIICCVKGSTQKEVTVLPTANGLNVQHKNGLSNSHAPPQTNNTVVMNKSDSSIAEVLVNDYTSNMDKQSKTSYDSEASVARNHVGSNTSTAPGSGTHSSMNFNENGSRPAECIPLSLQHFATFYYGPFLKKTPVKVVVIIFFLTLLAVGIYGALQVEDGLDLTDVVPSESVAHRFVDAQFKYFSFYPFSLITQDEFDYAYQQEKLLSYHEDFKQLGDTKTIRPFALKGHGSIAHSSSPHGLLTRSPSGCGSNCYIAMLAQYGFLAVLFINRVLILAIVVIDKISKIIRIPDSQEIPEFWLMYFREWLNDTQATFNQDWENRYITFAGWNDSASSIGVIAYKLLSQNDSSDKIDRSKARSYKLVSDAGIIRPEVFYKALTVWIDRDVLGYAFSQADIKPETVDWSNIRSQQDDEAMKVPAAKPITFAKINFNVIGLKETKDFVKLINDVREICDKYSDDGLPNYPSGVPFTFWEQYIWLGRRILIAISISLAVSFLVMAAMLFNLWAAAIIVLVLVMITVEVYGFMGLVGIKLSAVPAVTLILSVGVGVEFTVHMCMAFLHTTGDRNQRMQRAIENVFVPIVDGAISTFLGVVMLAGSEFQFIVRYFFNLLVALILIGSLNGVVFLPVVLSLAGPGAVATETPKLSSTSNSLAIQNPSSAESAINVLELEENQFSTVKKEEEKPSDNGSVLERTYQNIKHGAQVEPSDDEPRNQGMTTGKEPDPSVYDIKL